MRFLWLLVASTAVSWADFLVSPYLQQPTADAVTIVWFSSSAADGTVEFFSPGGGSASRRVAGVLAESLAYAEPEIPLLPLQPPPSHYRFAASFPVRPGLGYRYVVRHGTESREGQFVTAAPDSARFVVFGDCETEPESTGTRVAWTQPGHESEPRLYLIDQTQGFANNLDAIGKWRPDFILITGDLVQTGGEQRDWDEFWRHLAGSPSRLAAGTTIYPALGNHEYYAGAGAGFSSRPTEKYLSYFCPPNTGDGRGRYYRVDHGPVTILVLDVCNGLPDNSAQDTNFHLSSSAPEPVPDFNPGSAQYEWLAAQLPSARKRARFLFVALHHVPYSAGPHGREPGVDAQSGVAARTLIPLFLQHRVDALFCGHDEMYERSTISDGGHTLQVYDVGIGGDGLRAPCTENPQQRFLAHRDAPELWSDGRLLSGGKHYGHLTVEVGRNGDGWQAVLTPVYLIPQPDAAGQPTAYARDVYDDVVVLRR